MNGNCLLMRHYTYVSIWFYKALYCPPPFRVNVLVLLGNRDGTRESLLDEKYSETRLVDLKELFKRFLCARQHHSEKHQETFWKKKLIYLHWSQLQINGLILTGISYKETIHATKRALKRIMIKDPLAAMWWICSLFMLVFVL